MPAVAEHVPATADRRSASAQSKSTFTATQEITLAAVAASWRPKVALALLALALVAAFLGSRGLDFADALMRLPVR
jgi:hypothetical protein